MNIAVFGTGFVAGAYLRAIHYLGYHPLVLSRAWLNPDDANALALCLDGYKPQYIISASGFHVDTVDECQWDKRGCYHDHVLLPRALSDYCCLLYTSDAADERSSVDLGGRRIIKKKK